MKSRIKRAIPFGIIFLSDSKFESEVAEIDDRTAGGNEDCLWVKTRHEVDGETLICICESPPKNIVNIYSGILSIPSGDVIVSLSDLSILMSEKIKSDKCKVDIFGDREVAPSEVYIRVT